jgi:fermentation-respiration switch protein FrsA (DUF1100 family)
MSNRVERRDGTSIAGLNPSRRMLLKGAGAVVAATGAISAATAAPALAQGAAAWDKTFPKSERVAHQKVSFSNRLGITLVADLYIPKGIDRSRRHPALVVGHPFGGVKEQTSGLYAQTMAERGFITLAHDASFNGESGGQPHFIASPDVFVEDFSAAVDYLGTSPLVDRSSIGVIGVCASGGFALAAAQIDPRMKAVATVSMYDMGSAKRDSLNHSMTDDGRHKALAAVAEQRWIEFAGGEKRYGALPETLSADADPVTREFYEYYRMPRGRHPRSTTAISLTSDGSFFHFRPLDHLDTISPRPVLLVAGETAHSRYFSEEAFSKAAEPRELHIVPGAGHVDLYDRVDLIPWVKLQSFFDQHLV